MDPAHPDSTVLVNAFELLDLYEVEAKALEKQALVEARRVVDSEEEGVFSLEGKVEVPTVLTAAVSIRSTRSGATYDCDECGHYGCEHVLMVLGEYLGVKMSKIGAVCRAAKKNEEAMIDEGAIERAESNISSQAFPDEVRQRLGRSLTVYEESFALSVEVWFQFNKGSRMLSADVVNPFLEAKHLPAWELVELWPRRPESAWEGWLYLSLFIQGRGLQLPEFLRPITTQEAISQVAGEWQSQQALRQWEDGLDALLEDMEEAEPLSGMEVRLVLGPTSAHLQSLCGEDQWLPLNERSISEAADQLSNGRLEMSGAGRLLITEMSTSSHSGQISYARAESRERLGRLVVNPLLQGCVVNQAGGLIQLSAERLVWRLGPDIYSPKDFILELVYENGTRPAAPLFSAGGVINCYVTHERVHRCAPLLSLDPSIPLRVPAAGLVSGKAVQLLSGLGVPLPDDLTQRVVREQAVVRLECRLEERSGEEMLCVRASSTTGTKGDQIYTDQGWQVLRARENDSDRIIIVDESRLRLTAGVLRGIGLNRYRAQNEHWDRLIGKRFPEEFTAWIEALPKGFELELHGDLASLKNAVVSGSLKLELEESTPDWFDLHVALSISETELTREEIKLLLEARGKFVRLKDKGWRKLEFELTDEEADQLSELGVNPLELNGPPQRFHALQLAASSANALLEEQARQGIMRRAAELQTSVTPPVPDGIQAQMRGYQVQGFHFLAYLSTNHFGGILADDMGLGKTLQTLSWIAWLREQPDFGKKQVLVVCPKSVVQNWLNEAARFLPGLRTAVWRGGDSKDLRSTMAGVDLVVINYAQLRLSAEQLTGPTWGAIVLDEAQYIKNPSSQTAVAACCLRGAHRLALSGTPIENRLLDLWSIMHFVMPGLLGLRAHFNKQYDSRTDNLARRRLAARIRPFILRRTKSEVAKDLPARIEEDVIVEMEGVQAQMYSAELKRARQALLKITTSQELDKQRFNVLTSLLRLRQICCHPGLVSEDQGHADSAKMEALVDLLEPLLERGQKVLVFSQFVEMLSRIEREVDARSWSSFMLTGETEDRGELVDSFQKHEGSAVFLISLRAGGMGLNLTAASYVVLFDPWWNPAVENQAIDRTHRIGQKQQVIAYRLVAKQSVEEKIRQLQRTKSAMAGDILGEESFGKALTLNDFQFLLEG